MGSKHTPGPWERYGFRIESESGYYVADVIDSNGFGENKANARLIAAAPRMSAALKRAAHLLAELPAEHQTPQVLALRTEIVETIKQSTPEHYGIGDL